jgi:hypothetical protein
MANPFVKKQTHNMAEPVIAGKIRQSQLIATFGIGSIVDFIDNTVIIAGLDDWNNDDALKIYNENLQRITGVDYFISPKHGEGDNIWHKSRDVPSYHFPETLYCPHCKELFNIKYTNNSRCQKCNTNLVSSRFVLVCENGHMEDFPYSWWVHVGQKCDKSTEPRILMYNIEGRSDIDSLLIECKDCGKKRFISPAFSENIFSGENGYHCSGNHPHLSKKHTITDTECRALLKTRLRSSSGIYFPVVQSALAIPPWSRIAMRIIEKNYEPISFMSQEQALCYIKEKIHPKYPKQISIEDLIAAYSILIKTKNSIKKITEADVRISEYTVFLKGNIEEEDEYSACEAAIPDSLTTYFDKIVIMDKLTEVIALRGFTRLKPWNGANDDRRLVPLSSKRINWLPAVKVHGEGVFFLFNQNRINRWKSTLDNRYEELKNTFSRTYFSNDKLSDEYIMLHTFSHLLIRQLANDCGYNATSIKERIYSTYYNTVNNNDVMFGVLVYLSSSDSDGSLGGLISIAKNTDLLEKIILEMLQKAMWCSADPFCINSKNQGFESLNYAACHDCMLLPETSCEYRNILLDRVSIVGIPGNRNIGFMGDLL